MSTFFKSGGTGLCAFLLLALMACNSMSNSAELEQETHPLFAVKLDRSWGVVNDSGNYVLNPTLDKQPLMGPEGFLVQADNGPKYYDEEGTLRFEKQFLLGGPFNDGLAPVVMDGKVGFVDVNGNYMIEPEFEKAGIFSEGMAAMSWERKWGFVNEAGEVVINPQFDRQPTPFINGFSMVVVDKMRGYLKPDGKFAVQPQFDAAGYFYEGRALVEVENRWGYIDTAGKFLINPQFEMAGPFSEGLAHVRVDGKWGYIDETGTLVINPQFESADFFSGGLARVSVDGKFGYIDTEGKYIITPQFKKAGNYRGPVAVAAIEERLGLIDREGKFVANPQFGAVEWNSANGGSTELRVFEMRNVEVEAQESPLTVAREFLEAERRGDWITAKKYASEDTRGAIDLLSGLDKTPEYQPFDIIGYNIEGRSATVYYQNEGEAKRREIYLLKSKRKWLVVMEKMDMKKDLGWDESNSETSRYEGNNRGNNW